MIKIKQIISRCIFNKQYYKYIKAKRVEKRFVNYQTSKQVLLLLELDLNDNNYINDLFPLIEELKADGKEVIVLGYISKKKDVSNISHELKILSSNDFNAFYKPQDVLMKDLAQFEFDLLIDLSMSSLIPLQYLAMYVNAKTKVGAKKEYLELYDFMIDLDKNHLQSNDFLFLYNQIIFYLKSIQTSD